MRLSAPITVDLLNDISLRLYEDTRPNCLEIAQLQKGLVLIFHGNELIEEGAGFGTPVVQYEDRTYFSTSATCQMHREEEKLTLTKSFIMNAVSRKKIGEASYVNEGFYSFVHKVFHRIYVNHKRLALALNKVMELRNILRVQTEFVEAEPRGIVTVNYACLPRAIEVEVHLSKLNKTRCKEILILNEQGASFFRKYADTEGLKLTDLSIGAWEQVKANEASIADPQERLTFTLPKIENTTMFRGREKTRGRFSWAGLGYSVNPANSRFRYTIKLTIKNTRRD